MLSSFRVAAGREALVPEGNTVLWFACALKNESMRMFLHNVLLLLVKEEYRHKFNMVKLYKYNILVFSTLLDKIQLLRIRIESMNQQLQS